MRKNVMAAKSRADPATPRPAEYNATQKACGRSKPGKVRVSTIMPVEFQARVELADLLGRSSPTVVTQASRAWALLHWMRPIPSRAGGSSIRVVLICLGLAACQGGNPYVAQSRPAPARAKPPTFDRGATTGATT